MKVLHVETGRHFYGGAQQVAWLLEGLCARGVDNVLVCPPGSGIDAHGRRGARVVNLRCAGDLDLAFAWKLRRLLRRERPDLLHAHSRRGADFLGGIAAAAAGVPAIVSRRVDHLEAAWLAGLRYRPFEKVIAISANVAESLRGAGLADERIAVIRSAVAMDGSDPVMTRSELCAAFDLEEAHFLMAAVGQLIPRKGHRFLLEAMPAVLEEVPEARLILFGRGRSGASLVAQARRLGLGDAVRFAGFREDVDRWLGAFDLVVHPALREGLGVAMLKAAAAGRAVVAFDVAGAREAVVDGETGLLVPPGDPAAIARAILALAGDPGLRRALGRAGRRRMRTAFSVTTMVDEHMELYRSVISHAGRHGR